MYTKDLVLSKVFDVHTHTHTHTLTHTMIIDSHEINKNIKKL